MLRLLTGAHYYVSNKTIRNSLKIKTLNDKIIKDAESLKEKITKSHFNHISDIANRHTKELFLNNHLNLK